MKRLLLCVPFILHTIAYAKMSFVGRVEITSSGIENISRQMQDAYLQETIAQFQGFLMQGPDILLLPPDISACTDEAVRGMSFKEAWQKCPGPPNYLRKNFRRNGLCNLDLIKPRAAQFHASKFRVAEFDILPGTIQCRERNCNFRFDLKKLTVLIDGSIQDVDNTKLVEVSGLVFSLVSNTKRNAYVNLSIRFDASARSLDSMIVLDDVRVIVPQNVAGFGFHSGHVVSMTGMQGLEALTSSERQGFSWPRVYELNSVSQYWLALHSFQRARLTALTYGSQQNLSGDIDTKRLLTAIVSLLNDLILTHPAWMEFIGGQISEGVKEFLQQKFQAALTNAQLATGTKIEIPVLHMQDNLDAAVHDQAIAVLGAKLTKAERSPKPPASDYLTRLVGSGWHVYFKSMLKDAKSIVKGITGSHSSADIDRLEQVVELVYRMQSLASIKASDFDFSSNKYYQDMFLVHSLTHIESLKKEITARSKKAVLPLTVSLARDNVVELKNPLQMQIVAEFDPKEALRRPAIDSNASDEIGSFDVSVQVSYQAINRYLELMQSHEQKPFQACMAMDSNKTCRNGASKGGFRVGGAPKLSYDAIKNKLRLKIPKVQILKWKLGAVLPNAEQDMDLEIGLELLNSGSLHVFSSYAGKKQNADKKSVLAFFQRYADPRLMLSRAFDNVIISLIMNFIDAQMKKGKQLDLAGLESMDHYGIHASKSKIVGLELLPDSIKVYLTLNDKGLEELTSATFGHNFKWLQSALKLRKWLHRARQRVGAKRELEQQQIEAALEEGKAHEEDALDLAFDVD